MVETNFKIICDSCCDLPKSTVEALGVDIVPLYVAFSDGVYLRDYCDFTYEEFYRRMQEHPGDYPKTSLPGVEDYMRAWMPYVEAGTPVLSLSMTSKMSGSFNSARMAKDELTERFPDAQIEVVDTLALTVLEGMLVQEACRLRDAGRSLSEAAELLCVARDGGRAYFTIGDLSYLSKGGRIGALMKLAAVGLGLKPVVLFSDGNISLSMITRSRQKSLKELAHQTARYFIENKEDPDRYYLQVGYGLDREAGETVRELLLGFLSEAGIKAEPELVTLGTMVGAHNGPMLLGIALLRKLTV